jgi:hypothetical protein
MRISDLHQRGHAGRAACWMALRAGGSAPNITAFVLRESVALVSGQCGVPQWPGTTKLSRGFGQQRGHAGRPVFDRAALRAVGQSTQHHRFRFASAVVSVSARGAGAPRIGAGEVHRQCFASVDQCAGAQIWPRLACASCWISHRLRLGLSRGVRGSCRTRPLRPPASLLHNAALPSVPASRCAKAPLGAGHRFAPFG